MAFDKNLFIQDVKSYLYHAEKARDPDMDPDLKEEYLRQARPYKVRIEKVFALLDQLDPMLDGLLRIAYDKKVSDVQSNPDYSTFHVAYKALGGHMIQGQLFDDEDSLRARLTHSYKL